MNGQDQKKKTLHYRRVVWLTEDPPGTLESCLVGAHAKLSCTARRTFEHGRYQIIGAKHRHRADVGFFFHLSLCVPDQPAALVAKPSVEPEASLRTLPPPATDDYINGDAMVLVRGDDLVYCLDNTYESAIRKYIECCLRACGHEDPRGMFRLEKRANINEVELIHREGVRRIELGASLYEASLDYLERQPHDSGRVSVGRTLLGAVAKQVVALFAKDPDPQLREIHKRENLQVNVTISFDSRKKGGEIGRRRIESAADWLVEEEADYGFTIVTRSGKKLRPHQISLSTAKGILVYGNSISVEDAWRKLEEYLSELRDTGALEQ